MPSASRRGKSAELKSNKSLDVLDDGARRWLVNTARKNLWRVASWYELDDLIQEGYMCWQRGVTKYPNVKNYSVRMGLFKVIFTNHIHTMSTKRTRQIQELGFCDLDEEQFFNIVETRPCEFAELLRCVSEAAGPVGRLIKQLLHGDAITKPHRRWGDLRRELTQEKFCRMLGLPPDAIDLHRMLLDYLGGSFSG